MKLPTSRSPTIIPNAAPHRFSRFVMGGACAALLSFCQCHCAILEKRVEYGKPYLYASLEGVSDRQFCQ